MRATIAGEPLAALGSISWTLTAGPRPYLGGFEMPKVQAERVYTESGQPIALAIGDVVAQGLYAIRLEHGSRPDTRTLIVADRRILWERRTVAREYNVRKRSGLKRPYPVQSDLPELTVVVDDIAYRADSLREGRPWTAREILEDVLGAANGEPVLFLDAVPGGDVILEDAIYEGTGAEVVAMVLADVGGVDVSVRADGVAVCYARGSGAEGDVLRQLGATVYGRGAVAVSDRRWYRPSQVDVLFEREAEVRLDYESPSASAGTVSRGLRDGSRSDDPEVPTALENVLPLPDPVLAIDGAQVYQGTYVEFGAYLRAIAGTEPPGAPTITDEFLRKSFAYQGYLEQIYGATGDPVWQRRYATIWRHWRQTFRIVGYERLRFRAWKPVLATVADAETGTRAPSPVFAAYTRKPSLFGIWREMTSARTLSWEVGAWAAQLKDAELAPARIRVVDADVGILRVQMVGDLWGLSEEAIPGQLEDSAALVSVPLKGQNSTQAYVAWSLAQLAASWKLAIVITGTLSAPADERRLARVTVQASDLGVARADGPAWTVRASGGLTTARYRYEDTTEEPRYVRDSALANRDELVALARAEARRIYHQVADRLEGNAAYALSPEAQVRGSISQVTHSLLPSGEAYTSVSLLPQIDAPSLWAYVPRSVQDVTRRLVQQ